MTNLLKVKIDAGKELKLASQAGYLRVAQESIAKQAYDAILDGHKSLVIMRNNLSTLTDATYAQLLEWVKDSGSNYANDDEGFVIYLS